MTIAAFDHYVAQLQRANVGREAALKAAAKRYPEAAIEREREALNRADVLDPALVRPGRVDVRVSLDNATPELARRMWRRFGGGHGEEAFVAWAGDGVRSMAELQSHLLARSEGCALEIAS
jgi:hypothetical protein